MEIEKVSYNGKEYEIRLNVFDGRYMGQVDLGRGNTVALCGTREEVITNLCKWIRENG